MYENTSTVLSDGTFYHYVHTNQWFLFVVSYHTCYDSVLRIGTLCYEQNQNKTDTSDSKMNVVFHITTFKLMIKTYQSGYIRYCVFPCLIAKE